MEKFTIIIPTLWMAEEIYTTVEEASECELVDEIIIIDNAPESNKKKVEEEKVRKVSRGKNIYVNRAWNLGVKISKNKKLCICNDDITFDLNNTLKFINEKNLKELGIVGCIRMKHDKDENIEIEEIDNFIASGFGVLMFIHKENFRKIPEYVKIWWGDYWLFKNAKKRHVIKNIGLGGKYKTSVESFKYITEKDTFNKFTKMEPHLESEKTEMDYKIAYPIFKAKGYAKYFAMYPLKRLLGYTKGIYKTKFGKYLKDGVKVI